MANSKITYHIVKGNPDKDLLQELLKIYTEVFSDADTNFFIERFKKQSQFLSILAYHEEEFIGFKIGYPHNEDTFYSWIGGVLTNYRQKGVANNLAELQEIEAKSQGFNKIRTKSMNQFKPMMLLNLKRDYNIVKFYTNQKDQTKIVFEKQL